MDFQIIESQRTLPAAGTGAVNYSRMTDTGQDEMYRLFGSLGVEIGELGEKIYEKQGISEFTQKMFEHKEAFMELRKEIAQEVDTDEIMRKFDAFKQKVESTEMKNGIARDMWQRAMPAMLSSQANTIFTDWENQTNENYNTAIAHREVLAIQNENAEGYEKWLKNEVAENRMLEEEAETRSLLVRKEIDTSVRLKQNRAIEDLIGTKPNEVYKACDKAIKSGKKPETLLGVPITHLTIGHLREYRNVAQGDITKAQKEREIEISRQYDEIYGLAADSMDMSKPANQRPTLAGIHAKIRELDLTNKEQTELAEDINNSVKIWADTGINPYKQTTNYTIRERMKNDARDGRMTEKEVRESVGKYISSDDGDEIRRIMKGDSSTSSKAIEDTNAGKIIKRAVGTYNLKDKQEEIVIEEGYRRLNNWIKTQEKEPDEWEKKKKALSITNELEKQRKMKVEELTPIVEPKEMELISIWNELNDEEKKTVIRARQRGISAEEILEVYNRNK